jgi:hypothetical protein
MAARHLETLQLERDKVETAADFFEAYATRVLSQLEDGVADEVALVDAASSLRAAGQWAMFFDPRRAARLFTQSASIWHDMGYGFGTFVLAAIAPSFLDRNDLIFRLTQMAQTYSQETVIQQSSAERQETPEPLLHPQQQAYLLLAGAAMWRRLEIPLDLLRVVGDQSPHRRGVAPIGALGTPLRIYWEIARSFLDNDDENTAGLVARDLASMGVSYAQAIDSAMANERLWFNAAAPVDVGDIDAVAIGLIAARRLGSGRIRQHMQIAMEDLNATARVPLELANEMIDIGPTDFDGESQPFRPDL